MSLHTSQITSATNVQYKIWKSLLTSKGIKENRLFLLMGDKIVQEYLDAPSLKYKIEGVLCLEPSDKNKKFRQTQLSADLFKELDVLNTRSPMLVLSFEEFKDMDFAAEPQGLELITPLGDPRNLGAMTRTAVSFGVSQMILTQESTNPFLPHSVKASSGAVLKMVFKKSRLPLNEIKSSGENYALDLKGENIKNVNWPTNLRLWVGEEGPGLQLSPEQKLQVKSVHIPMSGMESLNAMVSTSLAIWEWRKKNDANS
jgi:RNA methyltransferase, TrmH family